MTEAGKAEEQVTEAGKEPAWWVAPWKFLVESLIGLFIFGVIGAAAVALNLVVADLSTRRVDRLIIWGLTGAEYALFFTDLVLYLRFLWKTASRIWKEL